MLSGRPRWHWLLIGAFQLAIGLLLVEGLIVLLLRHPALVARMPDGLADLVRNVYMNQDRHIIQFDPRMARYDPELFYSLRPGSFVHENREFRNAYRVNHAGMRDDEVSLDSPRIIVAGDSMAMGWGVDQEETFAQRIERATGGKVLNAAISSYGTVRELRILERARIDGSQLDALVIAYNSTDFPENATYFAGGGRLPVSDERLFDDIVAYQQRIRHYRPFLYVRSLVRAALGRAAPETPVPAFAKTSMHRTPEDEARVFLYALAHAAPPALQGARAVLIHLDGRNESSGEFLAQVDRLRQDKPAGSLARRMTLVDLNQRLQPEDYFVIDDHLRASGHAVVAKALLEVLAQPGSEGTLRTLF